VERWTGFDPSIHIPNSDEAMGERPYWASRAARYPTQRGESAPPLDFDGTGNAWSPAQHLRTIIYQGSGRYLRRDTGKSVSLYLSPKNRGPDQRVPVILRATSESER
jgi:hypothetical protein